MLDKYTKRIYCCWYRMVACCNNPNNHKYKLYGGRGITVCSEWLDFHTFKAWAESNGYREDLTLDRKDPDKGYYPDNCRWATLIEQNNNKRDNHMIEYNGKLYTMGELAKLGKVNYNAFAARIYGGWGIDDALNIELDESKRGRLKL